MQKIDILGPRPDRHTTFTRELLAAVEDDELQTIVEEAARELSMPIALVSLVLEQIQFFKAHYGLPADLAAARGTARDVSFCQFVVHEGAPFEVVDAAKDHRVPQQLVEEYGVRCYLGMPVLANGMVVGSLCVLGDHPHAFSDAERERLQKLAELVSQRLEVLSEHRMQARSSLVVRASVPALAELHETLTAIDEGVAAASMATTALESFHRLAEHLAASGSTHTRALNSGLAVAKKALEECQNALYDIEASSGDAQDCSAALESVLTSSGSTHLSEVMVSGQELARYNLRNIGNSVLPDFRYDPVLATPRPLAVALLATCLSLVAARMSEHHLIDGIYLDTWDGGAVAEIIVKAKGLTEEMLREVVAEVEKNTGKDPTVKVHASAGALRLSLAVAKEG
ncbi:MAG: GAF domain-containing protein [Candidatus Competibacteraceae bacterium]|nr:GAF domain-containing protein [Candidatus Competibacteraceae bacterium]